MQHVHVTHFSDVLCIWAYVSQVRCDELLEQFPEQASIDWRLFHVFGNVPKKIEARWADRGGLAAYADHVAEVAGGFDHVTLHPRAWRDVAPASSMPGHLFLCAVRCLERAGTVAPGSMARAAWALRLAFFRDGRDIGRQPVLDEVAAELGLPAAAIEDALAAGQAHAALAGDLDLARDFTVRASPTMVLNEGRQQLTGNVGYRVIEANVRELLDRPGRSESWC